MSRKGRHLVNETSINRQIFNIIIIIITIIIMMMMMMMMTIIFITV